MKTDKAFFEGLASGKISPRAAIAALVDAGHSAAEAQELVFVALGGSDLVETGADGVKRYPSGKTVDEVEQAMKG